MRKFRWRRGIRIGHRRYSARFINSSAGLGWFKKLTPGNQRRVSRFDHLSARFKMFGKLG